MGEVELLLGEDDAELVGVAVRGRAGRGARWCQRRGAAVEVGENGRGNLDVGGANAGVAAPGLHARHGGADATGGGGVCGGRRRARFALGLFLDDV